jgi:DNA polymerase
MSRYLGVDLETYSSVDLPKCGVYKYVESPDFDILLFAYAWDEEEQVVIDLAMGETIPEEVLCALSDPSVIKAAWNASFERTCLAKYLGVPMPPEQWEDTMITASVCGLPMSLGACGTALGLPEDKAKDREGKALIRWFCQPCKPTKTKPDRTRHLPEDYPEKWEKFKAYNGQDVVAERATMEAECRSRDADKLEAQAKHMEDCLKLACEKYGARLELERIRSYDPYTHDENDPFIQEVSEAMRSVGLTPKLGKSGGGSDVNNMVQHGITALMVGTGMRGAHTTEESIPVSDLEDTAEMLLALISK